MRSLPNSDYYSYLGFGVKDVTDEITTNKIFRNSFEITPVDCSEPSGWEYTVTTNESELRDKVVSKFSTSAKAGYAGFSMSVSYEKELSQENTSKTTSIYGVAVMKIVKGEITMSPFDPNLKSSIQEELYKSRTPSEFRKIFGDKFISGAVLGGIVMVKFEFTNVDYTSTTSTSVKKSAEVAFKDIMSAKVSLEDVKSKFSEFKNSSLKISCTSGGPILNFTDDIKGIPAVINKAIDEINNNQNLTRILNKYTYYSDIINDYSFIPTRNYNEMKNLWVKYRSNLIDVEPCLPATSDKHTEIVKRINTCNTNLKKIENLEDVGIPANDAKRLCLYICLRGELLSSRNLYLNNRNLLPVEDNIWDNFMAPQLRKVYIYLSPDIFPNELIPLYSVCNDVEFRYTTSEDVVKKYDSSRVKLIGYIFKSYHEGTVPLVENVLFGSKKTIAYARYKEEALGLAGVHGQIQGTLGFVVENPELIND
jgi:hypothetical protein